MVGEFLSKSLDETILLGKNFSKFLELGDVVGLIGNLGSGKTSFVRGICEGFGVKEDTISPTFTLLNEYHGRFTIFHFDCYRIKKIEELYDIGYEEYFGNEGICLIEWVDLFPQILPNKYYKVQIEFCDIEDHRKIIIERVNF